MWEVTPPLTKSASSGTDKIVLQKTHQLSENEAITYIEYASGFAAVFAVSNWVEDSHTSGSGYDTYVGQFFVTSGPNTSQLLGFKYTINHSSYDVINSFGSFYNVKATVHEHDKASTESASGPAFFTYMVYFVDDWGNLYGSSLVNLSLSNNKFSWVAS